MVSGEVSPRQKRNPLICMSILRRCCPHSGEFGGKFKKKMNGIKNEASINFRENKKWCKKGMITDGSVMENTDIIIPMERINMILW